MVFDKFSHFISGYDITARRTVTRAARLSKIPCHKFHKFQNRHLCICRYSGGDHPATERIFHFRSIFVTLKRHRPHCWFSSSTTLIYGVGCEALHRLYKATQSLCGHGGDKARQTSKLGYVFITRLVLRRLAAIGDGQGNLRVNAGIRVGIYKPCEKKVCS